MSVKDSLTIISIVSISLEVRVFLKHNSQNTSDVF
jgi:hypothetical protein